jgi:hypothetical protein
MMVVTEEASAEVGASRWDKDNKRLVREFNRRWEEYEARLRSNYKPLTKQERWALREVMTNAEIGSWRVRLDGPEKRKLNHPNAVVNRWKASTRTHELRHMRQPSPALTPAEKDRQGLVRKEALKEPEIDPATFSMTVQQKIEVWKRQEMGRMAAQFSQMVNARVRELLEETILPRHRKEQDEAKRVMNVRKGIMDKATFNAIRRGLHPDSRHSISDKMLGAAFDAFMRLEKLLLDEKQSPTDYQKLPETMAEWDLRREAANAAQKAKRAAGRSAVRPR